MKAKIIDHITQLLTQKKTQLIALQTSLQKDLSNESKSSMGDKYETGRAMIHLEMEKLNQQLYHVKNDLNSLLNIDSETTNTVVKLGSFVQTQGPVFFVAMGLGKIVVEDTDVFVISLDSPIGKELYNKKPKDVFTFNAANFTIESIS